MKSPKVSIIILNWNQLAHLRQCIQSIEENTLFPHYEIIIWDNGSTQEGLREYRLGLKQKVIFCPQNLGFAKGNNEAAQKAEGEFLLFLNNDVLAHKDGCGPCCASLKIPPTAALWEANFCIRKEPFSIPESCWTGGGIVDIFSRNILKIFRKQTEFGNVKP
ncbi:MAG: glycosyltransferase [Candidatus Omnitrophota bacterium]